MEIVGVVLLFLFSYCFPSLPCNSQSGIRGIRHSVCINKVQPSYPKRIGSGKYHFVAPTKRQAVHRETFGIRQTDF